MMSEALTDEQRTAMATAAIEKINEGVAEYVAATCATVDAEVLDCCVVLYEGCGIDGESGTRFTRTNFLVTQTNSISQALGVYEMGGIKLRAKTQ